MKLETMIRVRVFIHKFDIFVYKGKNYEIVQIKIVLEKYVCIRSHVKIRNTLLHVK